jgi:Flp pilus assembly pilin Flp
MLEGYVMRSKLQQFMHDETGAAAVEVGLIAAGICVAMITLASQMNNDDVRIVFERLGDFLRSLNLHSMT